MRAAFVPVVVTTAAQRAIATTRADAVEPDGTTPLHRAVHRNDLKAAESLIRGGADVNATNRYGVPPLALAATNGNAAMLELLLKAGANPNARAVGRRDGADDRGAHRQLPRR